MEITNGDSIGLVRIEFLPEFAPNHVKQIKTLIENDFYDGLLFHRGSILAFHKKLFV